MTIVAKKPDYILLACAGAILSLGILILSSASAFLSELKYDDSYYLLKHQLLMGILPGIFFGFIACKFPIEWIRKISPYLMGLSILGLVMIFIPGIGVEAGGARRWIHVGFATLQPSEFLKLSFIFYLASWLASHSRKFYKSFLKKRGGQQTEILFPFVFVLAIVGSLVVFQPDLSTFGIIVAIAVGMYFVSGAPIKHMLFIIAAGILAVLILVYFEPYRMSRLVSWMSPEADPMGSGFQASQALIIASSGGTFGQGFGSVSSKFALLPELIGDSIFAPYAAETGFVGCIALLILYSLLAWRILLISRKSNDDFSRIAASGIAIWFVSQSALNIASTIRLFPISGVPLPFISYGGTAMLVELTAIGFLLNLSRWRESI